MMRRVMEIVRLKKKKDIDFNKFNASYHLDYEIAYQQLGCRNRYKVRDRYMNTGRYLIHIEDMKNNVILECGGTKDFCASMFNFIKPK